MGIFLLIFASSGGGNRKGVQTRKDRERILQVHDVNLPENQYNAPWKNGELQMCLCSEPGLLDGVRAWCLHPRDFCSHFPKHIVLLSLLLFLLYRLYRVAIADMELIVETGWPLKNRALPASAF